MIHALSHFTPCAYVRNQVTGECAYVMKVYPEGSYIKVLREDIRAANSSPWQIWPAQETLLLSSL